MLPKPPVYFVEKLKSLHLALRDELRAEVERSSPERLSAVADTRGGDTIFAIDEKGESLIQEFCADWGREMPFALISEGIEGDGWRPFPEGAAREEAAFLLILDPIDGTRVLMYDKRSAWILSGVAPNLGPQTSLGDIEVAVQTEVPTTRHYKGDCLWAVRGQGAACETHNLLTGESQPARLRPSRATTVRNGFASLAKFFPAAKGMLASLEEDLWERVLGDSPDGNPQAFDDQYVSSGGQLYELMAGHDRFNADLRPLAFVALGMPDRLTAHPYDLCAELIARELGIIVTGPDGLPLNAPLDIRAPVAWIGYANEHIRREVEPALLALLKKVGN
ncbi:MAG: inositol monophosphatase [Armatimonadetes bacterium]|nr:inositol monophosphatase [Armatimonadota bacterium]